MPKSICSLIENYVCHIIANYLLLSSLRKKTHNNQLIIANLLKLTQLNSWMRNICNAHESVHQ